MESSVAKFRYSMGSLAGGGEKIPAVVRGGQRAGRGASLAWHPAPVRRGGGADERRGPPRGAPRAAHRRGRLRDRARRPRRHGLDRGGPRGDRARLRGLRLSARRGAARGARAAQWLLFAASLALAACLLAALEAGLRAAGVGAPDAAHGSPLAYQRLSFPTLAEARRADGSEVLRPA